MARIWIKKLVQWEMAIDNCCAIKTQLQKAQLKSIAEIAASPLKACWEVAGAIVAAHKFIAFMLTRLKVKTYYRPSNTIEIVYQAILLRGFDEPAMKFKPFRASTSWFGREKR